MDAANETKNETKIVLSPHLGVSAAELVAAWNSAPERALHTPARLEQDAAAHYDPLVEMGFLVVSGIAINLLSSLIYDLIKEALAEKRRPSPPTLTVIVTPQPDGSTVLVVAAEEQGEQ